MMDFNNYKLALNERERMEVEIKIRDDKNIGFMGMYFDDDTIPRSITHITGINKLFIDDRTVIGNISESLNDKKYIAIDDNNVEDVQDLLEQNGIPYDGVYESAYDAFVLDTTIDNINKASIRNNRKLSWIEKASLLNSQRIDIIEHVEDYIMFDDMQEVTDIAVRKLDTHKPVGSLKI